MSDFSPAIFGLQGLTLSDEEAAFFHDVRPWGIILFARNIESRDQLRALTDDLREKSGNAHLPILIDQEGGRVARLKPPLVPAYPPMGLYGELFKKDKAAAVEAARLGAALLAQDLFALGISINCAPCLDLRLPETSDVIGDRAFGDDVERVVALGRAVMDGFDMGGVMPVIKHMPGPRHMFNNRHHAAHIEPVHYRAPQRDDALNIIAKSTVANHIRGFRQAQIKTRSAINRNAQCKQILRQQGRAEAGRLNRRSLIFFEEFAI